MKTKTEQLLFLITFHLLLITFPVLAATVDCGSNGCVVCATDLYISKTCTNLGSNGSFACRFLCEITGNEFSNTISNSAQCTQSLANCNADCRAPISDGYFYKTCSNLTAGSGWACRYLCEITGNEFSNTISNSGQCTQSLANCNAGCRIPISNGYIAGSCRDCVNSSNCTCDLTGQTMTYADCTSGLCRLQIQTDQTCSTGAIYARPKTCDYQLCTTGSPGSDSKGSYKYACNQ